MNSRNARRRVEVQHRVLLRVLLGLAPVKPARKLLRRPRTSTARPLN